MVGFFVVVFVVGFCCFFVVVFWCVCVCVYVCEKTPIYFPILSSKNGRNQLKQLFRSKDRIPTCSGICPTYQKDI